MWILLWKFNYFNQNIIKWFIEKNQFKLSTQNKYELIIKFSSYNKKNEYFPEKKKSKKKIQKIKRKIISLYKLLFNIL